MFFVDDGIARRLELANAGRGIDYARAAGRLWPDRQVSVLPVAGGYAVYGGAEAPVNHVMGLGWQGRLSEADWAQIAEYYGARGLPRQVNLCPLAAPVLLDDLVRQSYVPSRLYAVLVLPLSNETLPPRLTGVEIHRIGANEADLWMRIGAQGFSGLEQPPAEIADLLRPNLASEGAIAYLARSDGQPAGIAASFVHEGVVELGSDAVRSDMRRRGVHRALIAARLAEALAAGCDLAMAITEPGSASQRNLQRAGFALAYHRLVMIQAD